MLPITAASSKRETTFPNGTTNGNYCREEANPSRRRR